jgi:hypothetical protein
MFILAANLNLNFIYEFETKALIGGWYKLRYQYETIDFLLFFLIFSVAFYFIHRSILIKRY